MNDNVLLKPIKLGRYELPNRIFMAPMTRSRADNPDNAATPLIAEYYAQRASAGLIITEGSQVSPQAVGYINTPGIYSPAQIEGWKLVTQAVHSKNGHIFCQLWHCGRISHPDLHGGKLPVAPSAINPMDKSFTPEGFKDTVTPHSLTTTEIHAITQDFRQAAENAVAAGFDGVEIHSANGYLFHQFFTNCSNNRKDEYGGSHENKARFFFETLSAIGTAIGFDRVGVRLNPSCHGFFGITIDKDTIPTFEYIARSLNDYHNLAYAHFTEPFSPVDNVPYAVKEVAKHFSLLYKGTMIINSGFKSDSGSRVIEEGYADAVAFGKPFISNPDLVERIASGAKLARWDEKTFYTPGPKGYTDYPRLSG
jgi:NADH:flavin oxidoreductases, Old Yellow Enzyme family